MRVGDLVLHKKTKKTFLVVKADETALVGVVLPNNDLGYFHKNWFEVVSTPKGS